jgi:hypothetical protein
MLTHAALLFLFLLTLTHQEYDYNGAFSHIYDNKVWNGDGPLSGPGSDPCRSLRYLTYLQNFISRGDVTKIVEVGFGDWEMMQHMVLEGKTYVGFEVVKSIKREDNLNVQFKVISALSDIKESGDLLICRDVMQHWPSSEIDYFIQEILPRFKYALLTNDYTNSPNYADIPPGGYRAINLGRIPSAQVVMSLDFQTGHLPKTTLLYINPKFT